MNIKKDSSCMICDFIKLIAFISENHEYAELKK